MTDWGDTNQLLTYVVAAVGSCNRDGFLSDARAVVDDNAFGKMLQESTMEEMQGMLKLLVEDCRRREEVAAGRLKREAEFETERTRMEVERQRRERETGKQMELRGHLESLMKVVADSRRKPEGVSHKRELCEIGAANRKKLYRSVSRNL